MAAPTANSDRKPGSGTMTINAGSVKPALAKTERLPSGVNFSMVVAWKLAA
jgi:hypothetical protein